MAGLAILLMLAGFGYLVVSRSTGERGPITVTALFDEASGLYEGNAVEILGIQVGSVTRVTPKDMYVEVELSIDRDVQVPADVMAATISTSVLTDRRVALSPPYTEGPTLQNHDLIPPDRTRTPVGFDRVLAMIDRLASDMGGDGQGGGPLAELVNAGASAAAGNGENIKSALGELSKALRMTSDGADTNDDLSTIITGLHSLTKAMSDNDATVRQFGSMVRATSEILAAERFGTGTTGRKMNEVLEQAAALLEDNEDTIKGLLQNGAAVTKSVNDNQRELAETFDVLPLMIDNVDNAIDPHTGTLRVHALVDKILFDSQFAKELCNMMGLRQLGCSTGTLQDYGPDFGLSFMLDSMTRMGQ